MLKNTLFAAGAAIALIASSSLPASAVGGGRDFSNHNNPEPVPEPVTVLGSILVGGSFLAKKLTDKKHEE